VVEPKEAETKESAHAKELSKDTANNKFLPEGQTVNSEYRE
jgi:hypothetical protein